jgi:type VI secretion system secreted protein Hcp
MHKKFASLIAGTMILATAASASAANSIFMTLTGQKSGAVKGGVTQKGRENTIAVSAFDDEIVSPRDPASGLPTGKRQHKPIRVTFELDQSAPILFNMMSTNENITQLELKFWHAAVTGVGAGTETQFYTVKLTNASIAEMHTMTDATTHNTVLEVAFTYQKIQWTWVDGGVTAMDSWQSAI